MAKKLPKQGRLEATFLPRLVRELWQAQATGTLHLWNRDTTKQIVFKKGDIVFAGTNVERERLGERLVRAGKIKRSVLDLSFRVMERSHERFGKTIVELGWVSPMEMQRFVAMQIKDIIYSVFTWDEGDYRFEPSEQPVPSDLALHLKTAEVIYEGACRISDFAAIRSGVGSWKKVLKITGGRRLSIPVTREDGFILSRVKEGSTIGDIVATSPLGEEESLRRIYALVLAGVLDVEDPDQRRPRPKKSAPEVNRKLSEEERMFRDSVAARHAALQFGNYYDRLGVDFGASQKTIREAYEDVMDSLEPPSSFRDYVQDIEKRISKVRRKVREAYEVLSVPETRRNYDRTVTGFSPDATIGTDTVARQTLDAVVWPGSSEILSGALNRAGEAELLFLEAKRLQNGGDYFDAIASMTEAVKLDPENGRYHRVLAQWLSQNPGCWESAQAHFEQAIELNPEDVESHLGLAALHEEASRSDSAESLYEKVLTLDPGNRIAKEKLEPHTHR